MKFQLPLLIGLASLAAHAGARAESAATEVVGFITIELNPSTKGYSAISPTLVNKTDFAGVVSASSAAALSFAGTPLAAGAYAAGYWVEVTNGAGEGAWTNITGNTASEITVADNMTSFIANGFSIVKIRKHVTVSDFFGATNSAGLQPGGDAGTADEVFFIEPGGNPAQTTEVFYDGTGWSDLDFNVAATKAIEPGQGLILQRKTVTPKSFVFTGYVKTGKSMIQVAAGSNVVSIPSAVGYTLASSGLRGASNSNGMGLASGGDAGAADEVFLFDANPVGISHFFDASWNDIDFNAADAKPLKEGTAAYLIHKAPAASYNWIAPAVAIAP